MGPKIIGFLFLAIVFSFATVFAVSDVSHTRAKELSLKHFGNNLGQYGISSVTDLIVRRTRTDEKGITHIRYSQTYKGLTVFEGEAIAHVDAAGQVTVTNALRYVNIDIKPSISRQDAVDAVIPSVAPQGTFNVSKVNLEVLPRGARSAINRLVWHITIPVDDGTGLLAIWEYFVDAHSGDIAFYYDNLQTSASTGTGKTMYLGDVSIPTDSASGTYYLKDLTRGGGNYTCDQKDKQGGPCSQISRSNNIFGNNNKDLSDRATAGADGHYGMTSTWDYFKNTFGRNGIDGLGKKTYSRVHYGKNYENAFWSNSCFCMTYGDGYATFYPLVSLDVAGHEMAHGVMSTEANLTYSGESGGLNESSSDIFGTLVEYQASNSLDTPDYWIGERIYKSNWSSNGTLYTQTKALRYMDDPAKDGKSPACWDSGIGPLDVHYSSGPNNHMFWLLSNGGTSKCNSQNVTAISRADAARIWYKAISDYMTPSTNYHGARTAALNAATALFGSGSTQYNAVNAAYAAINVF